MTSPPGDDQRPGVYARLAEEAEIRHVQHTPTRTSRWVGWGILAHNLSKVAEA